MNDSVDEFYRQNQSEILTLARALLAKERARISTVTLVNDLYLKLSQRDALQFATLGHFLSYLSRAMRNHLVDEARKRITEKRSGELVSLTLGVEVPDASATPEQILELDRLMDGLRQINPRLERVAEMRIFTLMSVSEIAAALCIAEPTVKRDWQIVKAYVTDALEGQE